MGSILEGAGAKKVAEENNDSKESKKNVTCEFCESVLFSDGSVKTRSARAKKLQTADDRIESLQDSLQASKDQVSELETQLKDAREKLAAAEQPPAPEPEKKKEAEKFAIR